MDDLDRKIIRHLQTDGRLSNHELAARIGLSPSPCLRRVKALEAAGIIRGYTAIIDQAKCGLPINVFVEVKINQPTDEVIRKFEQGVQNCDEIIACFLMTGSRDYLLHVVCSSLGSYEQFIRNTLTRLPGVASIDSAFAYGRVKGRGVYPL